MVLPAMYMMKRFMGICLRGPRALESEAGAVLKAQGELIYTVKFRPARKAYIMKPLKEKRKRKSNKLIFMSCPSFIFLVTLLH